MLHWIHRRLIASPMTRRQQRRLLRRLKRAIRVPDAYDDLIRICRKVKPAAVLDIGSNVGETVLNLIEEIPSLRVHAFEPTPGTSRILRERLAPFPNVTVHELAVGERAGRLPFFVNRDSQTNSLLDNDRGNREGLGELTEHVERVEVEVVALDEWIPRHVPDGPLVVKADIQGAEHLMLAGGRRTFRERVAALHSEVQFAPMYQGQADFRQLYDLLTGELGFEVYEIYPCGRDRTGRAGWTDITWVKPDQVLPLDA